jgi:hypothetical protein
MNDAEIIVEVKDKDGNWLKKDGHLLPSLFKKPNPIETGRDFRRMMVQCEQATGIFYAEITRSGAGLPVELHPLNPVRIQPWPDWTTKKIAFYRYMRPDGQWFRYLAREYDDSPPGGYYKPVLWNAAARSGVEEHRQRSRFDRLC